MLCHDDNSAGSILHTINGYASILTILITGICGISVTIVLRRVHKNLRRLMYVMSLAFFLRPIMQTFEFFLLCSGNYNSDTIFYIHFVRDIVFWSYRFVWIFVGIERIIATVKVKTYEKSMRVQWLFWLFLIASLLLAFGYSYLTEVVKINPMLGYSVLMSTAVMAIVMFSVIRRKNKTFRRLSSLTGERALKLTEKYQIIENLRSLDLLIPHSNIDAISDIFIIVFCFLIRRFLDSKGIVALYNLLMNFQMLAFATYWCRRNPQMKNLFRRSRASGVGPLMTNASGSAASEHRKNKHFVKNPLGERIQKNQTPEEHFNALKSMWKVQQ